VGATWLTRTTAWVEPAISLVSKPSVGTEHPRPNSPTAKLQFLSVEVVPRIFRIAAARFKSLKSLSVGRELWLWLGRRGNKVLKG
jgi:hypothetical protein